MSLTISFPPETEKKLSERATEAGQTVEGFVRQLIERAVLDTDGNHPTAPRAPTGGKTFDEVFAPLRSEVEASGITEKELEDLLEQAREDLWQERNAEQGGRP